MFPYSFSIYKDTPFHNFKIMQKIENIFFMVNFHKDDYHKFRSYYNSMGQNNNS